MVKQNNSEKNYCDNKIDKRLQNKKEEEKKKNIFNQSQKRTKTNFLLSIKWQFDILLMCYKQYK